MIAGTVAVLLFALVYWKALAPSWRPFALFAFGLAAFWTLAPSLAVNAALVAAAFLVLGTQSAGRFRLAIFLAIATLAANKYAKTPPYQVVGLSYVAFRVISLARAVERKKKESPGFFATLFYALFPSTFLSGPIEPYERFATTPAAALSRNELFASLFRISVGLGKKLLIVEPLNAFFTPRFTPSSDGATLWWGLIGYSLFVYLDFSAYSDLAIGTARLFGYSIGENFDWPYLSSNIAEFWKRWHISLSQFLRDHVFMPLSSRALASRGLSRFPLAVAVCASLVTMTLCGMWHGDRASFVFWGFGHGALLAAHQIYRQKLVGRMKAKARARVLQNPAYRVFGTLLTFTAVTLLWVPFHFSAAEAAAVYGRLFSVFFHSAM